MKLGATFGAAAALDPNDLAAIRGLNSVRIRAGEAAPLEASCRELIARYDAPAWAVAHLAIALALQERTQELRALLDYESLVSVIDLEPPAGYDSIETFNTALAAEVRHRSRFEAVEAPWDSPIRSALLARQDAMLACVGEASSPYARLIDAFKAEVERYRAQGRGGAGHMHQQTCPDAVRLGIVAHVLRRGGHLAAHVHPHAWVNAVYYVEVPEAVSASEAGAGWLHFAPPAYGHAALERCWPRRRIQPKPGRLVIFPSYCSHLVTPVEVDADRTTVAFEVTPARQDQE